MRKPASGGLVYSTEGGRMCPACRQPPAACAWRVPRRPPRSARRRHRPRQPRNPGPRRQGRDGGPRRDPGDADALAALGRRLRAACGSGGTLKDGVLEVQGDHRDRVVALLAQEGYTVKRAGG